MARDTNADAGAVLRAENAAWVAKDARDGHFRRGAALLWQTANPGTGAGAGLPIAALAAALARPTEARGGAVGGTPEDAAPGAAGGEVPEAGPTGSSGGAQPMLPTGPGAGGRGPVGLHGRGRLCRAGRSSGGGPRAHPAPRGPARPGAGAEAGRAGGRRRWRSACTATRWRWRR